MLSFREFEIADKQRIQKLLEGICYENSEFAFGNIYLWRNVWQIRICESDNVIYLQGRIPANGQIIYFQPVVPIGMSVICALKVIEDDMTALGQPFLVKDVNDSFLERLRSEDTAGVYHAVEDRDMFDYVYTTESLAKLSGKKLHGKRNHINKFMKTYPEFIYESLTPDHLEDCYRVFDEWAVGREPESYLGERDTLNDALTNMEALGFVGGLIRIAGRPIAFTFGEQFRPYMAVIQMEKAVPDIEGAFTLINQQFAENQWLNSPVTLMNREEDMGIDGLRRAKLSYQPEKLVKKYDISKQNT